MKNLFYIFLLTTILNIHVRGGVVPTSSHESEGRAKLGFTENKGQIVDQNYDARPDVLFGGQSNGLAFHLRKNGISYQLNRIDKWKEEDVPTTKEKSKVIEQQTIYRIDINWLNVNSNAVIRKELPLDGRFNFYTAGCPEGGALNVKTYKEVTYEGLYSGIDLKWYEKNGELKYDYLCAAGTDYKQIQLEIKGAESITINNTGELVIRTPLGIITEKKPLVLQQGIELKSKWVKKGSILSFEIENLNVELPYVIDPVVRLWGTYYGGSDNENARSCKTDASGNVYMAGTTESATNIATTGAHQTVLGGGTQDAFLSKFNTNGVLLWGTYYGGSASDFGNFCAVDASSNIYLIGQTSSTNNISTAGAHQTAIAGGTDGFVVKFNSSGVRQWGTYYGGGQEDNLISCDVDASGNLFVLGTTQSISGVITAGAHQVSLGGSFDALLVKFNSSGVRQWATYYGGTGFEQGYSCSVDASGDVYISGQTASNTNIATTGAHQISYAGGGNDGFLAKFNTAGVRQWGTYYGGSSADSFYFISTDGSGNVYATGETWSFSNIATTGAHDVSLSGSADAFLVKFNSSGVRQWATYYGGPGIEDGNACFTDVLGNVYMSGGSTSTSDISTTGTHQTALSGGRDAFLVKFNSSGVRQWGTYYGGTSNEFSRCSTMDTSQNIFMVGSTESAGNISTTGAHQTALSGISDAFLVKFRDCQGLIPTASVNATVCAGSSLNFSASISGTVTPTYSWSGPASFTASVQNPSILSASVANVGTYTVTANSGNGCIFSQTTTVNVVNPQPTVSVNNGTICSGNSFTIVPSGASTYTIQGGSNVVSPLTNTSYTVVGSSTAGCISANTATSNVTVNVSPTVSVNSGTICSGNSFTIVPSGASTYTIQGGSNVVSPSANTSYTVRGTGSNGCLSINTATSNVTVNTTPTVSVNNGTICSGNSFTIVPSGASTYTIQGGSNVVSPSANTSYTVVGSSTAGCISANTATSNVTVNVSPTVSVNNGTICSGNSFTIVPSGASTYTIQGGSNVVSPSANTSYTVIGTGSNGCLSANTATSNVTVNPNPTVTVNSGAVCSGNSFTIVPSGANTYTIEGGNAVVSPTANTSYTITGTSAAGCLSSNTATSNVTVNPNPTVTAATSATNFICVGQSATLTASGASTYTFNPGGTGANIVVSPTVTTTYTVTGTDGNGCSGTAVITQSVSACTGIDANAMANTGFRLYPNPTNGMLYVESHVFGENVTIKIMNALGQLVQTELLQAHKTSLAVEHLPNGLYFVQVISNGKALEANRFVKQ